MFIDKNSKALIKYLSETEPSNVSGESIYPTSSLAKVIERKHKTPKTDDALDSNKASSAGVISSYDSVYPYLKKLKDDGYIISYEFKGMSSVKIIRAVQLEFWKEYRMHLFLHDIAIPAIISLVVALSAALFTQAIQLSYEKEPQAQIHQESNYSADYDAKSSIHT